MKNELKIWCHGGALMYFKTDKTTVKEAFKEFNCWCDLIQLNIDNINVKTLELVDENGNEIDSEDW